jgi:hypothetical protein
MNTTLNKTDATFITAICFKFLRYKKGKRCGYEWVFSFLYGTLHVNVRKRKFAYSIFMVKRD